MGRDGRPPRAQFGEGRQNQEIEHELWQHYNGMLHHSSGREVFFSLQHLIIPALDLMPCLQAQGTRDCNEALNSRKEQPIAALKNFLTNANVWCIKSSNKISHHRDKLALG